MHMSKWFRFLGDCPPDPYKGSALGRHWILPSPDPYFCTFRGGMATGVEDEQLLWQSNFDIVAVFGDNVAVFGDIVAGVDGA